jgi:DNA-binding phage protein
MKRSHSAAGRNNTKSSRKPLPRPPILLDEHAMAEYLTRAFAGNPKLISSAVVNAGRSTNMLGLTRAARVHPSTLYRLLHTKEDLKLRTVLRLMRGLGMRMEIRPRKAEHDREGFASTRRSMRDQPR